MFCVKCGKEIIDDAKTCIHCGFSEEKFIKTVNNRKNNIIKLYSRQLRLNKILNDEGALRATIEEVLKVNPDLVNKLLKELI